MQFFVEIPPCGYLWHSHTFDFEGKDNNFVVNTILKRLKELTNGDELEYKNYLKKVNILSTNRDLEKEVEKGAKMLSVDIEKHLFIKWE